MITEYFRNCPQNLKPAPQGVAGNCLPSCLVDGPRPILLPCMPSFLPLSPCCLCLTRPWQSTPTRFSDSLTTPLSLAFDHCTIGSGLLPVTFRHPAICPDQCEFCGFPIRCCLRSLTRAEADGGEVQDGDTWGPDLKTQSLPFVGKVSWQSLIYGLTPHPPRALGYPADVTTMGAEHGIDGLRSARWQWPMERYACTKYSSSRVFLCKFK